MTFNGKATGRALSIPAGLALSSLVSLGSSGILSALAAWAILTGKLPEDSVGYCAMGILLAASYAGAATATGRIKRLQFQMGMAAGGIYFLCLLAVTALFFGGVYQGVEVTALVIFCGCTSVILLGPGKQNRAGCSKRRKRV